MRSSCNQFEHRRGVGGAKASRVGTRSARLFAIAAMAIAAPAAAVPPDGDESPASAPASGPAGPAPASAAKTPAERPASGGASSSTAMNAAAGPAPVASVDFGPAAVGAPHPLIVEVLFAVPSGLAGDANRDGERSVNGDEFVELVNPHPTPINLAGYTLTDSTAGNNQFRFEFPSLELAPGQSVVVFNGHEAAWKNAAYVGDSKAAPASASPAEAGFGGAWVLSARAARSGIGFANEKDFVLLSAPGGVAVQRVWWGQEEPDAVPGAGEGFVDEHAPSLSAGASVQRESIAPGARFRDHRNLAGSGGTKGVKGALFSPGVYVVPSKPRDAAPTPPASGEPDGQAPRAREDR